MLILSETLTGDTGVSIGLILGLIGLLGGGLGAAIASRITHGLSIAHLRDDLKDTTEWRKIATKQLQALETDKSIRDALQSQSSTVHGRLPR